MLTHQLSKEPPTESIPKREPGGRCHLLSEAVRGRALAGIPETWRLVLISVLPLIGYVTLACCPAFRASVPSSTKGTCSVAPGCHPAVSDRCSPTCLLSEPRSGSGAQNATPSGPRRSPPGKVSLRNQGPSPRSNAPPRDLEGARRCNCSCCLPPFVEIWI